MDNFGSVRAALCQYLGFKPNDFHPQYDYQYPTQPDRQDVKRGGYPFDIPWGWTKIALRVLGKYQDGDAWLIDNERGWEIIYYTPVLGNLLSTCRHGVTGRTLSCSLKPVVPATWRQYHVTVLCRIKPGALANVKVEGQSPFFDVDGANVRPVALLFKKTVS